MSLNHEKLNKRRTGARAGTGWRPRDGENLVRILPARSQFLEAWDLMEDLAIPFKIHFFKIEGRQTEVSRCLEELKQPCPACNMWRAYRKSEDPGLKQLAGKIGPADQYLFNMIDLNNTGQGIQQWSSNFTCWDKIMEIGANPAWGNVVDPADGVDFTVTLTPEKKSKTGFNQYSVIPSPTRTQVLDILATIPDWQKQLDTLEDQISAAKTPDEIRELLVAMGFPTPPGVPAAAAPSGGRPLNTAAAASVARPGAAPVARPGAAPVARPVAAAAAPRPAAASAARAVAPRPAAVRPAAPKAVVEQVEADPTEVEDPQTPPASSTAPAGGENGAPHYDPGPEYVPQIAEENRPAGAPRCFGDYQPEVHECRRCPVVTDCQLTMLGFVN